MRENKDENDQLKSWKEKKVLQKGKKDEGMMQFVLLLVSLSYDDRIFWSVFITEKVRGRFEMMNAALQVTYDAIRHNCACN